MILSVQQIKYELLAYIKEFGGDFEDWCIGVADDPKAVLVDRHRVDLVNGLWIYKQALTSRAALTVVNYFVDKLGASAVGESSESSEECDCVYAYRRGAIVADVPRISDSGGLAPGGEAT